MTHGASTIDCRGIAATLRSGRSSPGPIGRPRDADLAKLAFVEIHKGEVRDAQGPARYAQVRLHGGAGTANGLPVLGGWSDWWDYPAGETVVTHLDWNERDGVYETSWPGAVREARASAA